MSVRSTSCAARWRPSTSTWSARSTAAAWPPRPRWRPRPRGSSAPPASSGPGRPGAMWRPRAPPHRGSPWPRWPTSWPPGDAPALTSMWPCASWTACPPQCWLDRGPRPTSSTTCGWRPTTPPRWTWTGRPASSWNGRAGSRRGRRCGSTPTATPGASWTSTPTPPGWWWVPSSWMPCRGRRSAPPWTPRPPPSRAPTALQTADSLGSVGPTPSCASPRRPWVWGCRGGANGPASWST